MMRKVSIAAGLLLGLLVRPALAIPQQAAPQVGEQPPQVMQQTLPFDGVWEGAIYFDKEAFLSATGTPDTGVKYRLEISGPVVRAFLEEDGKFVELKPGLFHIAPVETNAVIFATEASPDSWVESVVFTVTQKDARTLLVQLARVVNNRTLPLSDKESKFATRGAGEFSKAAP
jgi:hypothetical protein